ncbi:hypothetical protein ABC766_27565 [Methylobacterium fujisawaense]|uniref:DUF6894 family protein n=1 Tax=Methylobacterium fujisawaense TaxID=107400 RepID=UPI0031F54237
MPRYFINTKNSIEAIDNEGTELPDLNALRGLMRAVLIEILRDEGEENGVNEYTAKAYDSNGRHVMSAKINFYIFDQ